MSFSQGEILLVSMAFTDGAAAKKRPVIVVYDGGDNDLLVAPATSHTAQVRGLLAILQSKARLYLKPPGPA